MIKLLRNRILAVAVLLLPAMAWSQVTQVTFVVPVNLTNLRPEIEQVRVVCRVESRQGSSQVSMASAVSDALPPVNGRLIAEFEVVVNVTRIDNPATETGRYTCTLNGGFRHGPNNIFAFQEFKANHVDPIARVPVTPITADFAWLQP